MELMAHYSILKDQLHPTLFNPPTIPLPHLQSLPVNIQKFYDNDLLEHITDIEKSVFSIIEDINRINTEITTFLKEKSEFFDFVFKKYSEKKEFVELLSLVEQKGEIL